ncbi:arginine--tRNA ligase [archaeon]|jgi:arginyl-tRNA synthetase|nr:arginine--tRNA ligase [archaeon]
MKQEVISILENSLKKQKLKISKQEIEKFVEVPPSSDLGDYAFPCFFLAEKMKISPHQIAIKIRETIKYKETDFEDITTNGPYINFFFNRKNLARKVVFEAITRKDKYGMGKVGKNKKVVVEFSSPNIAKPFGIGHLRSTIIGNSIANLCEFQGFKSVKLNYLGDWGTQFGKIILGFTKFGSEKKLEKDPIGHMLELYVKISKDKKYDEEAREWFKKLEEGDQKAVVLWRVFRELSLKEFESLYKKMGIVFDVYSGESDYQKQMKEVVKILKEKKLLKESEGALVVDLNEYNLGVALIQKSDGATLYMTRDLAAAIDRQKKYKFVKMVYEVGQEQKLHFKQLFKILELMGYSWAKNCVHVEHGLYLDKDKKKFATRKGKTILMKEVLDKTISLAKKEIQKRTKLNKGELEKRALKIAIASIFYGDLKNNRKNNVVFDLKRFVSFEGDTGPYVLYSYARASSIIRKDIPTKKFEVSELFDQEIDLVTRLLNFEKVAFDAHTSLNPSLIANYSYQLAKSFNEFYHSCPVIGSEEIAFRLALVEAFRIVLRNSLKLLGINVLEEM